MRYFVVLSHKNINKYYHMKNILSFLNKLSANNNKIWFDAHKGDYLEAKQNMEEKVQQLINGIATFEPALANEEAKKCIFRIYRDVRFSKNKDPYKNNMGAFIVPGGKKSGNAGYYLHIEPGSSFIAGGIYMPEASVLKRMREDLLYNMDEFKVIIENPEFINTFGQIYGEKLKNPPKGFPKDFPDIDILKFKSFTVMHPLSYEQVIASDFLEYALEIFKKMKDFNAYINRAIA